MADELERHPRGQISFGGMPLRQATDFEVTSTNNVKLLHTLRSDGASGYSTGNKAVAFSFNVIIPASGMERDFIDDVDEDNPKPISIKLPGGTRKAYVGVIGEAKISGTLEEGVKISCSGVGKKVKT